MVIQCIITLNYDVLLGPLKPYEEISDNNSLIESF